MLINYINIAPTARNCRGLPWSSDGIESHYQTQHEMINSCIYFSFIQNESVQDQPSIWKNTKIEIVAIYICNTNGLRSRARKDGSKTWHQLDSSSDSTRSCRIRRLAEAARLLWWYSIRTQYNPSTHSLTRDLTAFLCWSRSCWLRLSTSVFVRSKSVTIASEKSESSSLVCPCSWISRRCSSRARKAARCLLRSLESWPSTKDAWYGWDHEISQLPLT